MATFFPSKGFDTPLVWVSIESLNRVNVAVVPLGRLQMTISLQPYGTTVSKSCATSTLGNKTPEPIKPPALMLSVL